jgi:RNA polymerase sigma-70 factor (ECF subfamily)
MPESVPYQPKLVAIQGRAERSPTRETKLVQEAVRRAQAGDREGLHYLYVRYADDVQRYVRSFVGDYHYAEDITQNIFAKLTTAIVKYEPREVPFTSWILRVARNAALDHLRSRRVTPHEEIYLADDERSRVSQELGNDLLAALGRLPDEQREVLVLRHIAGLTPSEIAGVLAKTESSVHGLHHRGRIGLQAALRDLGATPVVMTERA